MRYYFNKEYNITGSKIFVNEFIEDVRFHSERGDEIVYSGQLDGYIRIELASGNNFQSGKEYWTHDNGEFNVIMERIEIKLDEELFTL